MQPNETIAAREIIDDILPKLTSIQSFVDHTLSTSIHQQDDADARRREENLKAEFEMELTIICMNIDHLVKQHEATFSQIDVSRRVCGPSVEMGQAEATAIKRLK